MGDRRNVFSSNNFYLIYSNNEKRHRKRIHLLFIIRFDWKIDTKMKKKIKLRHRNEWIKNWGKNEKFYSKQRKIKGTAIV